MTAPSHPVRSRRARRRLAGAAAALLLAATPAHLINSRVAMDFQAPLPFILAWLLCLLSYLRGGRRVLLFAAGAALGIGIYTYIAAYMLMPIYGLLTCMVLWRRREPLGNYWLLAAGFLLPLLCCLPFLVSHPTVIHDVFWHYQRDKPQSAGAIGLLGGFFTYDRFATAASIYWGFWNPRFLFINGPDSMWAAGAFLLPIAGLLAVGMVAAWHRPVPYGVLLIGGLLTAPIPASLVGDGEAIHRAAAVLPFGVLLAILGLQHLLTTGSLRGATVAFVATWIVSIGLAAAFHAELPLAQAFIRASSVPLAVAALVLLLRRQSFVDRSSVRGLAVVALVTLVSIQIGYYLLGYELVAWLSAAMLAVGAFVLRNDLTAGPGVAASLVIVVLATVSSHFMYAYADYSSIHRVRFIPASAILVAVRCVYAALALVAILGVVRLLSMIHADHLDSRRVAIAAAIATLASLVAYFYIDGFVDGRLRLIHAAVVVATTAASGALLARTTGRTRAVLGQLTVVAVLAIVSIQFAYFSIDYFTRYRDRSGNLEPEGNARVVWETVIAQAAHRSIPAVHLAQVGPYGFSDLYWTFYAIKHNRQDLLARTTSDVELRPDGLASLPDGSLVVTGFSPQSDAVIDRLLASGALRHKTLVTAPDNRSTFWILETGAGRSPDLR